MKRAVLLGLLAGLLATPAAAQAPYANTYSVPSSAVIALAATDVWCGEGVAGKAIYVSGIAVHGHAAANAFGDVLLTKRSTLNAGGTSTVAAGIPHLSTSPAGSLIVRSYTANPAALGTAIGVAEKHDVFFPIVTTTSGANVAWFGTPAFGGAPYVLRSASEALCLSIPAGSPLIGGTIEVDVLWQE
jgi:hypothetical protein